MSNLELLCCDCGCRESLDGWTLVGFYIESDNTSVLEKDGEHELFCRSCYMAQLKKSLDEDSPGLSIKIEKECVAIKKLILAEKTNG
uniref:Uncharacterized protein n=1 Tax=viral metagenome TaxID=1070528 RepID=A0A6H1ZFK4_9ZZZZ